MLPFGRRSCLVGAARRACLRYYRSRPVPKEMGNVVYDAPQPVRATTLWWQLGCVPSSSEHQNQPPAKKADAFLLRDHRQIYHVNTGTTPRVNRGLRNNHPLTSDVLECLMCRFRRSNGSIPHRPGWVATPSFSSRPCNGCDHREQKLQHFHVISCIPACLYGLILTILSIIEEEMSNMLFWQWRCMLTVS
jgi:hypothetical protein